MKLAATTAIGAPVVSGAILAIQGVRFDGTVTLGTLVTVAVAGIAALGGLIAYVGSKKFPSKDELRDLRVNMNEQLATLRQDVHNAVGDADKVALRESSLLESKAGERHANIVENIKRIEAMVEAALSGSRIAEGHAKDALHTAEMAGIQSAVTEKIVSRAMDKISKEDK